MRTMISVDEALEIIGRSVQPLGSESLRIEDAGDRTLTQDLHSSESIPPFDNSAMDGFALRSQDVISATTSQPVRLKIVDEIKAGTVSKVKIEPGHASTIMTGAPMPPGADAVIQIEKTNRIDATTVEIGSSVVQNENVRFAGEDVAIGDLIFRAGHFLQPYDLGMLASVGLPRVEVHRQPKIALISTGDELLTASEPLVPGKIRTSNNVMLGSLVRKFGFEAADVGIARDTLVETRKKFLESFNCDVIVSTGGVSMGEHDHVKEVLGETGVKLHFWKVRQRPGKPLVFGTAGKKLFFGLPGNPVSAYVCFLIYVLPALRLLSGDPTSRFVRRKAILKEEIPKRGDLRYFVRGISSESNSVTEVKTTGKQGSNLLTSLSRANCLIDLPESLESAPMDSEVDVIMLS